MTEPALIDALLADAEPQVETGLTVPLAQRYGFPPFSIIDRRSGEWQKRKRKWNALGLDSVQGRSDTLLGGYKALHAMNPEQYKTLTATSIFDPALCELAYDWFSAPGHTVLDPFAGGSVRGVVASRLGREYVGVDLSRSQIEANQAQGTLLADPEHPPLWINGDSAQVLPVQRAARGDRPWADFVFSCPPYYDLEQYSDGPADLSGMTYDEFLSVYSTIICEAMESLKPDRFACWVISDVRDQRGLYRGLVSDTINCFQAAGVALYNDIVLVDPVGSVAVRAARPFDSSRKVARVHQHVLVFVKGDPKRASADLNCAIEAADVPIGNGEATLF